MTISQFIEQSEAERNAAARAELAAMRRLYMQDAIINLTAALDRSAPPEMIAPEPASFCSDAKVET